MSAVLKQLNISKGGVPKRRIEHGYVSRLGVEGDEHAHPQVHGGPNQAILVLTKGAIDEIILMGHEIYAGALGENFTIDGLDRRTLRPGDRLRVGECVIELSKMRQPCRTLDVYGATIQKKIFDRQVKTGDCTSPRWGLAGIYARVLEEGLVREADAVTLEHAMASTARLPETRAEGPESS